MENINAKLKGPWDLAITRNDQDDPTYFLITDTDGEPVAEFDGDETAVELKVAAILRLPEIIGFLEGAADGDINGFGRIEANALLSLIGR